MRGLVSLVAWVLRDFGPILVFYGANHLFGFMVAIIATMAWSVIDVALVKARGERISSFLTFSITVTLVFGVVDVYLKGPFLYRYEAVMTNIVTACFFGLTLRGERSVIQEFAERRAVAKGETVPITPDTLYYFRLCTVAWTGYFLVKAAFYAWVSYHYDLERALAIRLVVGNATLYPLIFASFALARPIIGLLQRTGLAPSTRGTAAPPPPVTPSAQ